jgi:hypothetical protein
MQQEHAPREEYSGYRQTDFPPYQQAKQSEGFLDQELDEDEQLLWSDRPKAGQQVYQPQSTGLLVAAAIVGGLGLFFTILAVILGITVFYGDFNPIFIPAGILLLLSLIFTIVGLVLRHSFLGRDELYAITDKRIIIIRKGRYLSVTSYGKEDIGIITRIERDNRYGDIIFAPQSFVTSYGAHQHTSSNSSTSTVSTSSLSAGQFSGIANVLEVERLLRRTFKPKR